MALHKSLRENLAALQLCGRTRGCQYFQASTGKLIRDAGDEREFRANNRKINGELCRQISSSGGIFLVERKTTRLTLNATITRTAIYLFYIIIPAQLPGQSVLATSAAYNEDLQVFSKDAKAPAMSQSAREKNDTAASIRVSTTSGTLRKETWSGEPDRSI